MTEQRVTESRSVYERIEELKATGLSNAEAIRQVSTERGKSENAVRANQHQYRQKLGGGNRKARKSGQALTVEDAVSQARKLLEQALSTVDKEISAAKADLDAAQNRYNSLADSAQERKASLEAQIQALG